MQFIVNICIYFLDNGTQMPSEYLELFYVKHCLQPTIIHQYSKWHGKSAILCIIPLEHED